MIQLTLGDLIQEGSEIPSKAEGFEGIYVLSHEETVFYVGRSNNCARRILEHFCIGYGRFSHSTLTDLVWDNEPDSF
jgi:hypothetical protein